MLRLMSSVQGKLAAAAFMLLVTSCGGEGDSTVDTPKASRTEAITATTAETFTVSVPSGVGVEDALLSATERVFVEARVTLGTLAANSPIASLGAGGLELGANTITHGNAYNAGGVVELRSSARVNGFVRATGAINPQTGVVVTGGTFPNTSVPSLATTWTVEWPVNDGGVVLVPDDAVRTLPPGAYAAFDARSRSKVYLTSGTYYFTSFNSEPNAQIFVDKSAGPIFIYARNQFRYHGEFVDNGGEPSQVLVGYLGTLNADLQVGFLGTIVAPNAQIDLRRPTIGQHRGAFFGKRVQVSSDTTVVHVPFDWGFLCPLGDTDGDNVVDCTDECPRDPAKTKRGLCGCNVPETDTDGDKVPNCRDLCPTDPNNVKPGQCGCAGSADVKPAGTPCTDGICGGTQQCNGAGKCGDPTACRPEAGCTPVRFDDHTYWRCPGRPWTTARTRCDAVPGMSLVQIDSPSENALVASLITGNTWIGANDRTTEGAWRWSNVTASDGPLFWNGAGAGSIVDSRFANWRGGEPGGGGPQDCGAIGVDGRWYDDACTVSLPYLCETSITLTPTDPPERTCPFPGASCDEAGPRVTPCVPIEGPDLAAAEAQVRACFACGNDETCANAQCVGAASRVTAGTCTAFSGDEKAYCEIAPGTEVGTCSFADTTCPAGSTCGVVHRCHDVFKDGDTWRARSCAEGCLPGHACGSKGYCVNPDLDTACDLATTENDECFGQCFLEYACGQLDEACAATDTDDGKPCEDVEVCSEPDVPTDELDPGSDVEAETFNPTETFGIPPEPTAETFPADEPPCPVDGSGNVTCNLNETHPWCRYDIEGGLDDKQARDTKQGSRGSGSVIQFDFDPNVDLDFQGSPLPFGEVDFRVRAAASFRATSTFDLAFARDTIEIVDAVAALQATRCNLSTSETRLEVFGLDFLPVLGIDAKHDTEDIFPVATCEGAIGKFLEAANRAKKALRDAQELVRQYEELRAQGTTFALSLCETLANNPPANFPPLPAGLTCEAELPEATINRFIQYAIDEAARIGTALEDLNSNTLSAAKASDLGIPPISFDKRSEESQTIVNITFFVGPVPANLSVEAVVSYGLRGGFTFNLSPGAVLQDSDSDIVSVTADAEPFANAGILIFVGAGIDFGGLAVKIGVGGNISLGEVALPAYASAGIRVHPENDPRDLPEDLPDDLREISTGQTAFPFNGQHKQYRFAMGFRYGASFKLDRILAGSIDARVKVKFFFFSKTWKKKLVDFGDGFGFGTVPLLNGGAEISVAEDFHPWGVIRMPAPLVKLKQLVASIGPEAGVGTSPIDPNPLPAQVEPLEPTALVFDSGRVEELFFDSLCTCNEAGQDCTRNDDCCEAAPFCFDDPSPEIGPKCSTCRGPGSSCNNEGECCEGSCANNTCQTCLPHGVPCSGSTLQCCDSQDSCFAPIGQSQPTCTCVPLGGTCRNVGECCNGANRCRDLTEDGVDNGTCVFDPL